MKSNTKHTTLLALLTAVGLIIFVLEGLIPPLVPIPGIKLGLANIVVLYTLYRLSYKDAWIVMIMRVLLASVFGGQITAFWYSISGGVVSFGVMCIARKIFGEEYMYFTGAAGGVFHNIGQLFAAVLIAGSPAIFWYAPALIVGGIVCGLFTGIICRILCKRLDKIIPK